MRADVAGCPNGCWMICTARTSILENRAEVASWIAKNKLRAHRAHRGQTVIERIEESASLATG